MCVFDERRRRGLETVTAGDSGEWDRRRNEATVRAGTTRVGDQLLHGVNVRPARRGGRRAQGLVHDGPDG